MYHFEYHKKDWLSQLQVKSKYPWLFWQWLSEESILARFFLLEYFHQEFGYTWKMYTNNCQPQPIRIWDTFLYWSISHSENYIAFIIWNTKVAIDIAEVYPRSIELLDIHLDNEYYSLRRWKTWEAFFILWTAKEVIIKLANIKLDNMSDIQLKEMIDDSIIMTYDHFLYNIKILEHNEIIIAYGSSLAI